MNIIFYISYKEEKKKKKRVKIYTTQLLQLIVIARWHSAGACKHQIRVKKSCIRIISCETKDALQIQQNCNIIYISENFASKLKS